MMETENPAIGNDNVLQSDSKRCLHLNKNNAMVNGEWRDLMDAVLDGDQTDGSDRSDVF